MSIFLKLWTAEVYAIFRHLTNRDNITSQHLLGSLPETCSKLFQCSEQRWGMEEGAGGGWAEPRRTEVGASRVLSATAWTHPRMKAPAVQSESLHQTHAASPDTYLTAAEFTRSQLPLNCIWNDTIKASVWW